MLKWEKQEVKRSKKWREARRAEKYEGERWVMITPTRGAAEERDTDSGDMIDDGEVELSGSATSSYQGAP